VGAEIFEAHRSIPLRRRPQKATDHPHAGLRLGTLDAMGTASAGSTGFKTQNAKIPQDYVVDGASLPLNHRMVTLAKTVDHLINDVLAAANEYDTAERDLTDAWRRTRDLAHCSAEVREAKRAIE